MRPEREILDTARDERPFSNGTEWEIWSANWCYASCQNPAEVAWQRYENGERKTPPKDYPGGCPLILCAMIGKTPSEWLEQESGPDRFHCIEFRGPDEGGNPEPRPKRDPPGMDGLFERPARTVRMFKQPEELSAATLGNSS